VVDRTGQALRIRGSERRPPERRAHARARASLEASYEDASGQVFLRTGDLSLAGVFLRARHLPPIGSPARVLLEIPGDPAIHRFSGVVVRHQDPPEQGFAVAFRPPDLPGGTRDALERFLSVTLAGAGEDAR
jgi:hypothetical protein